ncbi:MAG TPA: hypothetical protein VHT91_29130 [Kofleriaceae bacterium]|nr:hypothetical protein [Kofleriaceae bacterium]
MRKASLALTDPGPGNAAHREDLPRPRHGPARPPRVQFAVHRPGAP